MAGEIDRKIELIAAAEDDLFKALKGIDQQLAREIIKIYAKFVVGGELVLDAAALAQLEDSIIAAVASTDYKSAIDTYIPNFDAIKNLNKDIHKELNKIDAAAVLEENDRIKNFQSAVEAQLRGTNAIKIQVTEGGVKNIVSIPNNSLDELIQPIADIIRTDIIQGVTFESATERILDEISKKRLGLEQWAGQIARDALNQADGVQNDEIRKEFDLEYVRYVGTIATNTRPVCYHFMTEARVIKYEDLQKELDKFIPNGIPSETKITYAPNGVSRRAEKGGGMIPGTNAENWMIRRGGYNCRHTAIPAKRPPEEEVIDELAPEAQAESIQFVPAKSIKEAEEFAVKNGVAKKVDYRKVSIDYANSVNENLIQLKNEYGVTFDEIKSIRQKTAKGASLIMEHNATYDGLTGNFKNSTLRLNGGTVDYLRSNIDAINKQYPNVKILSSDNDITLLNKWQKQGFDEGWFASSDFNGVINHEYGHLLTQVETNITEAKRRRSSIALDRDFKISRYAGTSGDETLAETWAKYKEFGKESLTKNQIDFFNKYSNSVKIK